MSYVISRDRVAQQFHAAADAVLALTIQDGGKAADSLAGTPVRVTGEGEPLMTDAPGGNRPSEVLCALAEKLAAHGFDVQVPDPGDGLHLAIMNLGCSRCDLIFDHDGSLRWEYRYSVDRDADPAMIIRLVLHLLAAGEVSGGEPGVSALPGVTLKGLAGRALDTRGLDVRMLVHEDPIFYDVAAEIVVTNPARLDRGQVRLTDDGGLTWECSYRHMASGDADDTANALVSVMAQVVALSRPRPGESEATQAG